MTSSGISAHGTLLKRNGTTIAEIKDWTPPALMRNAIELTPHNDTIDQYTMGVLRRGEANFQINFIPNAATHGSATGLIKAVLDKSLDIYTVEYPDTSTWLFSGFVQNFQPNTPTDDALTADITLRPTGPQTFNDAA